MEKTLIPFLWHKPLRGEIHLRGLHTGSHSDGAERQFSLCCFEFVKRQFQTSLRAELVWMSGCIRIVVPGRLWSLSAGDAVAVQETFSFTGHCTVGHHFNILYFERTVVCAVFFLYEIR